MKICEEKHGAVPFWFWNGDQTEDEITRQLDLARQGGWRGFAVHARCGNRTPYLTERWMQLVRHTCIEAKKRGLEIWLYDEEGFPSGSVGGRLPAKGEKYQQIRLSYEVMSAEKARGDVTVVAAFLKHDPAKRVDPASVAGDTELLVFRRFIVSWAVNYLSREAGEEFLRMTHDKYEKYLGEFLGDPMTVVYTDDINYMAVYNLNNLPWSDDLEQYMLEQYGYRISDKLSAVVENLPDSAKVRRDLHFACATLLAQNFIRPMHEWAKKHNMYFTGHLCGDEGPFPISTLWYGDGSAFYMEEDVPGIDDFKAGNHTLRYMDEARNDHDYINNGVYGFPITTLVKQASGVGSQFKEGKCSSEVLTSLGWGIPFRSQMAQIFFEYLLGVNIIVPHDCSYTTENETKFDHPASFFFQQPYFGLNKELHRILRRTESLVSRGRVRADTLILFPMNAAVENEDGLRILQSGRHNPDPRFTPEKQLPEDVHDGLFYTELMENLNLELLRRHVSFEYGFERLIADFGKVEGKAIRLGDCTYHTLILPAIVKENLPDKVRAVLEAFRASGGRVIELGAISDLPDDLEADIAGAIPPQAAVGVRLADGKKEFYFVSYGEKPLTVRLDDVSGLEMYDPLTGTLIRTEDGKCPSEFVLAPYRSCHFLPAGTLEAVGTTAFGRSDYALQPPAVFRTFKAADWTVTRQRDNVLVLDRIADETGAGKSVNCWIEKKVEPGTPLKMKFNVPESLKSTPMSVYYEPLTAENIRLNGGRPVDNAPALPMTQALAGFRADTLKSGENGITFTQGKGITTYAYVTGDFSVRLHGDKAELASPAPLSFGDLTEQGLPFYWGSIRYTTEFELDSADRDLFVEFGAAEGVVSAEINGVHREALYTAPWRFPLKGALKAGKNTLTLTLCNTAQNFFGPHRAGFLKKYTCDTAWRPAGNDAKPDEAFSVASFGIMDVPRLTEVK